MPKPQRTGALCALLCALHGVCAVTYGEPGVGSQYQSFGRPIVDTSRGPSAIRSGADTVFAVDMEGADAAAKACEKDFIYSDVFGKCLPAQGKDGYIGKADAETAKGKAVESTFMPIGAQAYAPMSIRPLPLHGEQQPAPTPAQPHGGGDQSQNRGRTIAPVRQLRLACPAGFAFEPAMGACLAPANRAMIGPEQQPMRMFRRRGGEDENDDSDDELRRERAREFMLRGGRPFHRHMFRRRRFGLGGARILAPVFVFVLPPLDRNATSRFGMGFGGGRAQRIHEIHPSMVGPIGGATTKPAPTTPPTTAPAVATPEQPIAKPKEETGAAEKPIDSEPKPMGSPKGTETGTPETPKALRGAFVNPIVGSGKALPLKSQSAIEDEPMRVDAGVDDRAIGKTAALKGAESEQAEALPEPLLKRHAFVSPVVMSHRQQSEAA